MKKWMHAWVVAALFVMLASLVTGHMGQVQPNQTLLSQCADQINNRAICRWVARIERYCCIQQVTKRWCVVDKYEQQRQPPLPPSVYYTKPWHCLPPVDTCTPMPQLTCP